MQNCVFIIVWGSAAFVQTVAILLGVHKCCNIVCVRFEHPNKDDKAGDPAMAGSVVYGLEVRLYQIYQPPENNRESQLLGYIRPDILY